VSGVEVTLRADHVVAVPTRSADRARFEAHLAECEGCTPYVAQVRQTIEAAATLWAHGIEPTARDDLLSAFRAFQRGAA
jgi:hypothetical protein